MLSTKYMHDFLDTNKDFKATIDRIIEQEKISGISLLDWSEVEVGEYLKSFQSISAMALNRQFSILRNFADFICEKEGIPKRNFNLGDDKLYDFIDKEKLLLVTINYEDYRNIKNQLDDNVREKLIFELAWYGLTNDVIKMLKMSDISFEKSEDFGWEIAFLNIGKDFPFKIEDPEVVEDIKKCTTEMYHIIESSDGRIKRMQYRDSDYLIKPINVGKNKKEDYISNPSLTLQKTFVAKEITCDDIDVYNLSIEDIRRSGLVYLLSPENEKDFSMDLVTILYGYKNDTGLYWLKNFAKEKYSK
jgi:hypothetical protein